MVDPNVVSSVLSNVFLFLLILGMAGTTDVSNFRKKLRNYRGIGTGLGCQFVLLPFLGFSSVMLFGLPQIYGVMLLIVTSSPGGGFSGWWCSLCNADLALSVAMTTVSTLFSIALLPLNIFIYVQALYGLSVPLDWGGIMISVSVVIAGVLSGLMLGTRWSEHKKWFNRLGTFGGLANIAVGIATASGGGSSGTQGAFGLPWWWYAGVAAPCIIGLVLSFAIARLLRCSNPESVAICIECCYQNTALAIAVAVSVFEPEEATRAILVPLYYGVVEIVLIALFALVAWQANWTYSPRTDNLLQCIVRNYQPDMAGGANAERGEDMNAPAPVPPTVPVPMHVREENAKATNPSAIATLAIAPAGTS